MTSPYLIQVRDINLVPQAEVDDFAKLEFVLRFNGVDTWVLNVSALNTPSLLFTPGAGIIVSRNGSVLFSGPVTGINRKWDASTDSYTISGLSDDVYVPDHLALPCATPFTAQAYDVRGPAAGETVIKGYVTANMLASGWEGSGRAVTGLTVETDLARGLSVKGSARFDPLDSLLSDLAIAAGGLGYRILQVGTGIQFQVYQPTDRTASIVFAPNLGNLRDFEYGLQASDANYVYAAGGGVGTARAFAQGGDSSQIIQWNRRIERFKDRRDTSDATILAQSVTEELAAHSVKVSLTMTPTDTAAMQFQTSYNLGDKVTVLVDDVTPVQNVIREIHISVDNTGEIVVPTVGTPGAADVNNVLQIFSDVEALQDRVQNLERQ